MTNSVLQAQSVAKHFGGVHAVEDVAFELFDGEVVGLVGDNGAGKSTLINMIAGVLAPTHGTIHWQGEDIVGKTPKEIRDLGIETIYQDLALADNLDIAANLFLGREPTRRLLGIIPALDQRRMRQQAKETLHRLRIDFDPARVETVRDLSGGQRQAVAIGRAIFWNARLLIMDEPTAALGVKERKNVLNLIRGLREHGVTVLLISHNFPDVFALTDRVLVMRHGRLIATLKTNETSEHDLVSRIIGATESSESASA